MSLFLSTKIVIFPLEQLPERVSLLIMQNLLRAVQNNLTECKIISDFLSINFLNRMIGDF
jgi:hypothetical protein